MATRGENRLTDTALKRLRLTDGKALALDGGGLRATVTQAGGRRVARFIFRFQGARVDMRLGTWPDKSLAELRALRNEARALVRAGKDPRAAAWEEKAQATRAKAEKEARLTVRGLFERWDKLHLRRAYKDGGAEPRRYFEKELLPLLGDLPAEEFTRAHVARVGELLRAQRVGVGLQRGEWHIPAENAKNGRAHLVHLSDFARARFLELRALQEGPWVIGGRIPGNPTDEKALTRLVTDRQRVEGLPGRTRPLNKRTKKHTNALVLPGGPWRPHDLRRTAATLMQELGVLPAMIEKCLNHSEPALVRRTYQRAEYLPERRDAFSRLGAHLERIAQGQGGTVPCAPDEPVA